MSKIISVDKAAKISKKLRAEGKKIVLSGGCFDILHLGHINFLKQAKKCGDYLFLLLESDASVKKLKGNNRPINLQLVRANILASIQYVDYVIILKGVLNDKNYDEIIKNINPDILAVTKKDPKIFHAKRQAKLINARVESVIARINDYSTTGLISKVKENGRK